MKTCKLCNANLSHRKDFNLVFGSAEFRPIDAISQLPFGVANLSPYVCEKCNSHLKSYVRSKQKTRKIEEQLKATCENSGTIEVKTSYTNTRSDKSNPEYCGQLKQSECKEIQTNLSFPQTTSDTVAYIHVFWPSSERCRKLPSDLTKIGIYLLRTQNKNIAKFAFNHPLIRAEILTLVDKEVHKECQEICREYLKVEAVDENDNCDEGYPKSKRELFSSIQQPGKKRNFVDDTGSCRKKKFVKKDIRSVFKLTGKEDMISFSFGKANMELKERCPLFWRVLVAASTPHIKKENTDLINSQYTAIVTAAAVCLKNRSQRMTTVQLLISLIINHSSHTSTLVRLKAMRLSVSHTFFNKKMDEFGQGHDEGVNKILEMEKAEIKKKLPIQLDYETTRQDCEDNSSDLSESAKALLAKRLSLISETPHDDLEIDFSVPVMKKCYRKFGFFNKCGVSM